MANNQFNGGKGGAGVFQNIINLMPPHTTYVEAFLGSGIILKKKRPAHCSIAIEIDSQTINRFLSVEFDHLENFTIKNGDALEILPKLRLEKTALIYCDPPYLLETRKSKAKIYNHEMMTEGYHLALLSIIKRLDCMVLISGYESDLYNTKLSTWCKHQFKTTNRAGQHVTETVWMNYPTPFLLHDYRYLGDNFKEREKIRLKKDRLKNKLLMLPTLERMALIGAVEELKEKLTGFIPKDEDASEAKSFRQRLIENGQQDLFD